MDLNNESGQKLKKPVMSNNYNKQDNNTIINELYLYFPKCFRTCSRSGAHSSSCSQEDLEITSITVAGEKLFLLSMKHSYNIAPFQYVSPKKRTKEHINLYKVNVYSQQRRTKQRFCRRNICSTPLAYEHPVESFAPPYFYV